MASAVGAQSGDRKWLDFEAESQFRSAKRQSQTGAYRSGVGDDYGVGARDIADNLPQGTGNPRTQVEETLTARRGVRRKNGEFAISEIGEITRCRPLPVTKVLLPQPLVHPWALPGIAVYKAINTLDSMIAHRSPRYRAFGWASARIDDVANLIPARLTALLFAATSTHPFAALGCMLRDARSHRSPNAGWPEAAMAGALAVRLSGPRAYAGGLSTEPWVNAGAPDPDAADIRRGLSLYVRAMLATCALLMFLTVL